MRKLFTNKLLICINLVIALFIVAPVFADSQAVLSWDANDWTIDPDLAGYKVYYGLLSGVYTTVIDIGLINPQGVPTYIVKPLADGEYFFVVTAYDSSGNESGFSNEVSKKVDSKPPRPRTGLPALIQKIMAAIVGFLRGFG